MRRSFLAVLLVATVLTTGCTPRRPAPAASAPFTWRELAPVPGAPAGGRVALRDAVSCAHRWYVIGALVGPDGVTRPGAWSTTDGAGWTSVLFQPRPDSFYGPRDVIYSLGCADDRLVMVGSDNGGAHGNPRVSTWVLRDGAMVEQPAAFELFGGPDAVDVERVAAGPAGFLIAGDRTSGAAVWLSPDGTDFALIAGAEPLAGTGPVVTAARDVTAAPGGWVVAGSRSTRQDPANHDPAAWTSPDGRHWRAADLPADGEYEEAQRVLSDGDHVVAAGLHGATFGTWRTDGDRWRAGGRFGTTTGGGFPAVRSLARVGDRVVAAVTDGAWYGLWASADLGDSWRGVAMPVHQAVGGDRAVALAGDGDTALLMVDDGRQPRLWLGHPA